MGDVLQNCWERKRGNVWNSRGETITCHLGCRGGTRGVRKSMGGNTKGGRGEREETGGGGKREEERGGGREGREGKGGGKE